MPLVHNPLFVHDSRKEQRVVSGLKRRMLMTDLSTAFGVLVLL